MFMAFHANRSHLPYLIAGFAVLLAAGIGVLLS